MLRLLLDYMSRQVGSTSPLSFAPGASWYSEALLPSRFRPTSRADRHGEGYTHADGVVGHFSVDSGNRGEAVLRAEARQFIVLEAKMGSALSKSTKKADYYDQAARNVACMAHMMHRAGSHPDQFDCLAFFVIAPASRINMKLFDSLVSRDSIENKVRRRVAAYEGNQDAFLEVFLPILDRIQIAAISWESILASLPLNDETEGLRRFYHQCLRFNLRSSSHKAVAQ